MARATGLLRIAVLVLLTVVLVGGGRPGTRVCAAEPWSVRRDGADWWLVSPEGQPCFSVGACVVGPGTARAQYDPENPGYAAWRFHDSEGAWAESTLRRLRAWGFTTLGGWSDFGVLGRSTNHTLALTPVLHLGSTAGAPWWDMWDPVVTNRMEAVAREQIVALRDDPRLLGYYSDNELGWWNATLWKMTLEHAPTSGQRQRLIRLLRETYRDDWAALRRDFEAEKATDWASLERGGMLFVRPGGEGFRVMRRFLGLVAERYYQLAHDIIRRHDPRALILGDRYQSFYYPEVARAAAPWVDVISANLNANWDDGTFLRSYLGTLHALTGRPVIVSEFYASAARNRSGNRNTSGVFPVVDTQRQRAATARNTLVRLARLPWVIGADWFQYHDEPTHGRPDGENFNFGLVDIDDRPYDEVTSVFARFNARAVRAQPHLPRPDLSSGVPPAPRNPFAEFRPNRALRDWDRERGFVPCQSEAPVGDLYLCWDRHAIYAGLYTLDFTEDSYYRDRSVPKVDRALWTIEVAGAEPFRVRLGAGREPIANDPNVRIEHLSGLNLNVRSVTAVELTAARLGRRSFRAGDTIELRSVCMSHGQVYRMEWSGSFVLGR